MPWYLIFVIVCVIVGPFEAFRAYNQIQERKEKEAAKEKTPEDPA